MNEFQEAFRNDFGHILKARPGLAGCRDLKMFSQIFNAELFRSCEFSFRNLAEGEFEIAAEAKDAYFPARVEHFLEFAGASRESMAQYRRTASLLDYRGMIVKAGFSDERCSSFSVYFRREIDAAALARISGERIGEESLAQYSRLFGNGIFFAGVDMFPFKVVPYIIQSHRLDRTVSAFAAFAGRTGEKAFEESVRLMNMLTKNDVFISFSPDESKIKADFMNVPATAAFKVVKDLGLSTEDFKRALEFAVFMGTKNFYYFSIASRAGSLSAKYYFKRFYSAGGDVSGVIADQLERISLLK